MFPEKPKNAEIPAQFLPPSSDFDPNDSTLGLDIREFLRNNLTVVLDTQPDDDYGRYLVVGLKFEGETEPFTTTMLYQRKEHSCRR